MKKILIFFYSFVKLPYSHLIDSDRQESVTAALLSATTAANFTTSVMEQSRLEEEKLRVHAKDKKNQSNIIFFLSLNIFKTLT